MTSEPLLLLGLIGASVWVGRSWLTDYRAEIEGKPRDRALPGATPASTFACTVAALGALLLLAGETSAEHLLGLSAEQSMMTALLAVYAVLSAPVMEEVLFRGYLVIEHRGRAVLWIGIVSASLLFTLLHPFLWKWTDGGFSVQLGPKAWFSTVMVFAMSIWFYAVRFFRLNAQRSLLPCLVAHTAKNVGVVLIKYSQGFLGGWW